MARTARDTFRQVAVAGLLSGAACAVMQDPPGGPPDFDPPVILRISPDSGAVAEGLRDPLVVEFDEVINEQSGGDLARLFEISPRHGDRPIDVDWRRRSVAVRPGDGWRPDIVYQVRILPGVADLRNNRLDSSRTVVFTTGGPLPTTLMRGTVLDWENGRVGARALIEATLLPDSLVYTGQADSTGDFLLATLPRGRYLVTAVIDANANRRRELREPFDTVSLSLDSSVTHQFWAFAQDTLGPQLRAARAVDSTTLRLEFSQKLAPGEPPPDDVLVWALPDTTPVVATLWSKVTFDSVTAGERAARDTATADSIRPAPDTLRPAPTPAPAPTTAAGARPGQAAPPTVPGGAAPARGLDSATTARIQALLAERPALSDLWYLRLQAPLRPGDRLLIEARPRNVGGFRRESRVLFVAPAARDST